MLPTFSRLNITMSEEESYVHESTTLSSALLGMLNKQRLQNCLCDVTVVVDGRHFRAHRAILAAASGYFYSIFTQRLRDHSYLELQGVNAEGFAHLLEFSYTCRLILNRENIRDILSAAIQLRMRDVLDVCSKFQKLGGIMSLCQSPQDIIPRIVPPMAIPLDQRPMIASPSVSATSANQLHGPKQDGGRDNLARLTSMVYSVPQRRSSTGDITDGVLDLSLNLKSDGGSEREEKDVLSPSHSKPFPIIPSRAYRMVSKGRDASPAYTRSASIPGMKYGADSGQYRQASPDIAVNILQGIRGRPPPPLLSKMPSQERSRKIGVSYTNDAATVTSLLLQKSPTVKSESRARFPSADGFDGRLSRKSSSETGDADDRDIDDTSPIRKWSSDSGVSVSSQEAGSYPSPDSSSAQQELGSVAAAAGSPTEDSQHPPPSETSSVDGGDLEIDLSGGASKRKRGRPKLHPTSEDSEFVCEVCGKSFRKYQKYRFHMSVHSGVKPFQCKTCGASFRQAGGLKSHIRLHTGEKPYQCSICGARFRHCGTLSQHMRVHTGERPYKCDFCGKRFTQLGHLQRHTRIHTGERPYECETCHARFTQKEGLREHRRIHTGERPYKCDTCGARFTQSNQVRRHAILHQQGEKRPLRASKRPAAEAAAGGSDHPEGGGEKRPRTGEDELVGQQGELVPNLPCDLTQPLALVPREYQQEEDAVKEGEEDPGLPPVPHTELQGDFEDQNVETQLQGQDQDKSAPLLDTDKSTEQRQSEVSI
ncbi:B-cell lymphoma 6 protein-like isoform X2 [Branchiostoma floridae]|uniref:B-cell lymphoma 6 protein-like isoform X2 n=1 Tax=Branchiostoma floridae TaxID=7739 RepID=A0A9J7L3B6_BRAFL|nr:B-cell lymphoma 6 protein-like isoform X2 [Branchiostoma floridae]